MNFRPRIKGWAAFVAVALAGCGPSGEDRAAQPEVSPSGPAASAFFIPSLKAAGESIDLNSFRGRVALLDFWATWCPPCRSELPELARLFEELKDQGFVLVGMTVDQGAAESVAQAVGRFEIPYPVGLAGPDIQAAYGGIRAVPTKFLLDAQGKVRKSYLGVVPVEQLRADISALLAETKGAPASP
ncbi:MAG TPA: TlpA disulfide reductase family protein [Kiritimatiellia bacterium]|nr:TlpA disulfide reductase family protein [Kiritimatiellia bacterium]HRZ10957.1 TlpA disulfide reductase family protein [Kiritimatiellia bacterium]HSA18530.1 TlpA disulfide reductase family protein [Kiritimatiellia bacterium]